MTVSHWVVKKKKNKNCFVSESLINDANKSCSYQIITVFRNHLYNITIAPLIPFAV